MEIAGRKIGPGQPVYTIAELSCNHNQDIDVAMKLIEKAAETGADAIKLQTYTADTITIDSRKDDFRLNWGSWEGEYLHDLYKRSETPRDWHRPLKEKANSLGLTLFTSPFDTTAVDFLEELEMPAYKIASFEVTDHILIKRIAQTGKPVIISSGMASLADLEAAVKLLREHGTTQICMLKCTSAYPAKPSDANLRTMVHMRETFGVLSGLSDHTLGIEVPVAATVLGASVIEKHFTLSRDSGSADDPFSLTPDEFGEMVRAVHTVEQTLGRVVYGGVASEAKSRQCRRSLYFVRDVEAGEELTPENVKSIRPGYGLETKYYDAVLGKRARRRMEKGDRVSWDAIE